MNPNRVDGNTDPSDSQGPAKEESLNAEAHIQEEMACVPKLPSYAFEELAHGAAVVRIVCAGSVYCLRRTKAGKLVLNK